MKFLFAYDVVSKSLVVCQMVHNEAEFHRLCEDIKKAFPDHYQDLLMKYCELPDFEDLTDESLLIKVKEYDFNG